MTVFESVLDAIGGTPLLRLNKIGGGVRPRIYAKLEFQNIGGSVKDRAALSMIRAAEEAGLLKPGGTVVEGTSGNTGIGLSLVAAQLGYRSVILAPAATAAEKIRLLRAYGSEVHLVADFVPRSDPGHLANRAAAFAASTPGAWLALQYDNPANPDAHCASTGPEIWADTAGAVTHFVASVGTGGTISGTGRFLKKASDGAVQVIAADPEHSRYGGGNGSLKYTEGAGHPLHPASVEDVWPEAFDTTLVDKYFSISDRDAIFTARRAAREEGLLIGATGGTALAAALQLAETLDESHTIVVVVPDSGRNYLSTYFDDAWLTSLGFLEPTTPEGTIRSLLTSAPAGVQLLASGLTAAEAAVELHTRKVRPDEPVFLVLDRGDTFGTVHPREVLGVVTLESLSAVEDAAPAVTAALSYRTLAAGLPALDATDSGIIAVLIDGRIAATSRGVESERGSDRGQAAGKTGGAA